jgi:hypothetical protein
MKDFACMQKKGRQRLGQVRHLFSVTFPPASR